MSGFKRFTTLTGTLISAGVAAATIGTTPAVSAEVNLKIANVVPAAAPRSRGAELIVNMVNKDKRCNLNAKSYPGGQLGGTTDLIEGLQDNSIEMVILPGSFLVGFQPLMGIMDFPFFWPPKKEERKDICDESQPEPSGGYSFARCRRRFPGVRLDMCPGYRRGAVRDRKDG